VTRDRSSNPVRPRRTGLGRVSLIALALALAAPDARASDAVTVPVAAKARRAAPLPSGEKIELSLDQTVALTLQNVLDLDVASYTLDESRFGIQASRGVFDPYVQLDLGATNSQVPATSTFQASQTKTATGNFTFAGLLPLGTTYALGWTNRRLDQTVTQFTTVNPTYSSGLSVSVTQPLLRNFGRAANERFVIQAKLTRSRTCAPNRKPSIARRTSTASRKSRSTSARSLRSTSSRPKSRSRSANRTSSRRRASSATPRTGCAVS